MEQQQTDFLNENATTVHTTLFYKEQVHSESVWKGHS